MTKIILSTLLMIATQPTLARIYASPSSVFFGTVDISRPTFASRSVLIRNMTDAPTRIYVRKSFCDLAFTVWDRCTGVIPKNSSCSVNIQFRPRSQGSKSCSLDISDENFNREYVRASGRAVKR